MKKSGTKKWPREVDCTCGAVLEVALEDVKEYCEQGYDYLGEANGPVKMGARCPECQRWIAMRVQK